MIIKAKSGAYRARYCRHINSLFHHQFASSRSAATMEWHFQSFPARFLRARAFAAQHFQPPRKRRPLISEEVPFYKKCPKCFWKSDKKNDTCRRRALLLWNISSFSFKPWCVGLQTRWFQPVGSPADCLTWSNLNSAVLERTGKGKKQDSIRWHLCEWRDKIDNQVTA